MSHPKGRRDQDGKPVFTWNQFSTPFSGSSSTAAVSREGKQDNSYEILGVETHPEPVQMVSELSLLKDANANLMKKILQETDSICKSKSPVVDTESELESACSLVYHLKSQVEQLKTQLSTQGTILRNALSHVHKFCAADPSLHLKPRVLNQSSHSNDSSSKFNRPSDELFRAYFTQQLYSSSGTVIVRNPDSDGKTVTASSSDDVISKSSNSHKNQDKTTVLEKVCPICELVLPPDTPQSEFEEHVFQCLDHDNTIRIEQFEMV